VATNRLKRSALIVATSAIDSFTTSFVSVLAWCSGRVARRNTPSSAPPKMQTNTMPPIAIALKIDLE